MFNENDGTFKYWFAHWCAYQMIALNCKAWKFKYLFHDIDKPFLALFIKNHKRVKEIHRRFNKHHITYSKRKKRDWEAMIIDWECSRFTKSFRTRTAREELNRKYIELHQLSEEEYNNCLNILNKFGL